MSGWSRQGSRVLALRCQPRRLSRLAAGQTIANSAIVRPGTGGKVCIYSSVPADVLIDVAGYFPAGSDYTPIPNPTRLLDTRNGIGT